jgi:hypothetical protein
MTHEAVRWTPWCSVKQAEGMVTLFPYETMMVYWQFQQMSHSRRCCFAHGRMPDGLVWEQ